VKIGRFTTTPEFWTTVATALRLAGGLLILPWALRVIPADEMGIWYIWGSLGTFSAHSDFGISGTITRAAAFYWVGGEKFLGTGLSVIPNDAAGPNWNKLEALAKSSKRLYLLLGIGLAVFIAVLGRIFVFRSVNEAVITPKIEIAWWIFVGSNAVNLYGRWQSAFINGVGQVAEVARLTVLSTLLYLLVVAVVLKIGGGLLALSAGQVLPTVILNCFLNRKIARMRRGQDEIPDGEEEVGLRVLWPTSWRFGIVMVGVFLINNANMLVCARFLSLGETASYGLANQIVTLVTGVGYGLVGVRVPEMVSLRTSGRTHELHRLVGRQLILCVVLYLGSAIALLGFGAGVLEIIGSKTMLPASGLLVFFLFYRFLDFHHGCFGTVIMTENRVPFVLPALIAGAATVGFAAILVPRYGLFGAMLAPAIIQALYNNWWMVWRGLKGMQCSYAHLFRMGALSLLRSSL